VDSSCWKIKVLSVSYPGVKAVVFLIILVKKKKTLILIELYDYLKFVFI